MNLATLPNSLIAHIAGYLEYSDVQNLMKTNKRIYNAIKYYGKNKIRPDHLRFSMKDDQITCVASGDADVKYDWLSGVRRKVYTFDNRRLGANIVDNIAYILSQCSRVRDMDFHRMPVNSNILKMLNASTVKIGSISILCGEITCSPKVFIAFVEKYRICHTKSASFPRNFWTDDVFVKIIPHVVIQQFPDELSHHSSRMGLSDRTLMKVFEHCNYFDMPGVMTSFTVEGIVKGLQVSYKGDRKRTGYALYLGVLNSDQLETAERYFNKETGEFKDLYKISVSDYDDAYDNQRNYTVEFGESENHCRILFSVLKPFQRRIY